MVVVVAVAAFGGYKVMTNHSTPSTPHYNCSAEKSANIEEYMHCHPAKIEKFKNGLENSNTPFIVTFDAKGDQLNVNAKFKEHMSDMQVSAMRIGLQEASTNSLGFMSESSVSDVKSKIIAPVHLNFTFMNDDGSIIASKDFTIN